MGNILPEHLFNDNTIIKTLNDPSPLYRIKKKVFSLYQKFSLCMDIIQRRLHYQQQRALNALQHFGQQNR